MGLGWVERFAESIADIAGEAVEKDVMRVAKNWDHVQLLPREQDGSKVRWKG